MTVDCNGQELKVGMLIGNSNKRTALWTYRITKMDGNILEVDKIHKGIRLYNLKRWAIDMRKLEPEELI